MARYFEIDALRGLALVAMIVYHTLYSLYFFTETVPWFDPATVSGAPIAATFIGIAGLSLVLAKKRWVKHLVRGLVLIGLGLVITIVTWFFVPSSFVVFGVLSLIGVGTIVLSPLANDRFKWYIPAIAGPVLIALGYAASNIYLPTPVLVPLGIRCFGFSSIDYEPILPWLGVMLVGLAVGKLLYPSGTRIPFLERFGSLPNLLRPLCYIGRHTLVVYMVHVPVIILILILTGIIPISLFF